MFLRRSQKNSLNRQKKKVQKKLPPCEKGPCARLLPNVGVPKILPDRKFPILRCVLKSCSHSNAVTVILLTLIASLHPHSVPLSFSFREHCTFYLQYRAGLRCFTADSVQASSWDFMSHWEVIADSEVYISLCFSVTGATIRQLLGSKTHEIYCQWHVRSLTGKR